MLVRPVSRPSGILLMLLMSASGLLLPSANAASCKTGSEMTVAQRNSLSSAARTVASHVQTGDTQALRAISTPSLAAGFDGISASVDNLKPLLGRASVTVESLYLLDASTVIEGTPRTDFYCGTPLVVLNFDGLPPGTYSLAILHATGITQPQQISLVLSETPEHHWMLAGFFSRAMTEAGHDGLWYWISARNYAQKKMSWDAWLYYRTAAYLLQPVDFLSSPNLEKLQNEAETVRPESLPGANPVVIDAHGAHFQVTTIDSTAELGSLDLDVHYAPDASQASELHNPPAARKQVLDVMTALLSLHPELRLAFHGIWVHADQGNASAFALELPMEEISTATNQLP